jgi:Phosphotransferase system, mannitol-specific IIBC component
MKAVKIADIKKTERANQKVTQPIISIKNYIGDPKLDQLINDIKQALS